MEEEPIFLLHETAAQVWFMQLLSKKSLLCQNTFGQIHPPKLIPPLVGAQIYLPILHGAGGLSEAPDTHRRAIFTFIYILQCIISTMHHTVLFTMSTLQCVSGP